MAIEIVPLQDPDILLEINNSGVPGVNPLDQTKAEWLLSIAEVSMLALLDGRPAGVLIVMGEDCGLNSVFLDWFRERWSNFIYLDRVSVADWARGQGVARVLYQEVDRLAQSRGVAIASEVYSNPPNLPSLNLHARMGYQEVGEQFIPAESKTVVKLIKQIDRIKNIDTE